MNILIGSRALNYWLPSFKIKDSTDWDVVSLTQIEGAEFHDKWMLNNDDLYRYCNSHDIVQYNGKTIHVCSLKGLSLVKRSHLHRDLSFGKHITHYWRHLEAQRRFYTSVDWEFLAERTKMTHERFQQGHPNLNQSVDTFFVDGVTKKYNHDYLHELIAYEDKPMYARLQTDATSAWCKKELWDTLTKEQQLQCVAEETYVIAIERMLVPNDWKYPSKLAYMKALQKVCTTLCSGWFRDFGINNYPSVLDLYNSDKFQEVQQILQK